MAASDGHRFVVELLLSKCDDARIVTMVGDASADLAARRAAGAMVPSLCGYSHRIRSVYQHAMRNPWRQIV